MESLNRIEQTYRRLRQSGREIIRLFSGNPNEHGFRFPSEILEAAYARYFQTQDYLPHPKGLKVAREAISRYYRTQGAELDPENILITSGTSESFLYLFSLLGKSGGNFLTPNPAYPLFDHIAEMAKVELRHYFLLEEVGWSVDVKDLQEKVDGQTRGIILISPNNPTGAVISAEQIHEIVEFANQKNIPLICDEVFSEFYFGAGKFPRSMEIFQPQLCFTLNGISKMFALSGLKLSWIAVTGEPSKIHSAVDTLETMNDTYLTCHIPIQEALPSLLSEGQEFLAEYREEVRWRRDLVLGLLSETPHIEVMEPQGGFYLMGKVEKDLRMSEEEFVIRLMEEKGIFVHPGYFYDYERGIRFVISFLAKEERLKKGIELLIEFIETKEFLSGRPGPR